jgi:RNA polymerase primary sigma factor
LGLDGQGNIVAEVRSEEKVERAIADLVADWERQEGVLRRSQVERMVLKRRLSLDEGVSVFRALDRLGFELEASPVGSPSVEAATDEELERHRGIVTEEFLPSYFSQKLLTPQQEIELGRRIQLGLLAQAELESGADNSDLRDFVSLGEHARNCLIEANLRLVLSIAQKFKGPSSLDIADLVQNGTFGLLRAAELFNPDLGLKFSTYATHWIRQGISRGIDSFGNTIRLPVHRLESIRKFRRARRTAFLELGRQPSIRDIAQALDWKPEKVAYIQHLSSTRMVSLETPVTDDSRLSWSEVIESSTPNPEQVFTEHERRRLIKKLLDALSPRQKAVLIRRFGLSNGQEDTLQKIGDDFCVTRERIRQIETKALKRAKPKARSMGIEQFI